MAETDDAEAQQSPSDLSFALFVAWVQTDDAIPAALKAAAKADVAGNQPPALSAIRAALEEL